MTDIVIVGAGQAAGQAAASMRQGGFKGGITILGDEAQPPYQRPPLSKQYLSGEQELARLYVRPEQFYSDHEINLQTETRVTDIAPEGKTLSTAAGTTYPYGELLIATGSRPRILKLPQANLNGIHYLRTIADVDRIRAALSRATKVCILGGGYIGLEVAAVIASSGLDVSVIEMEARILQRVTTAEMSAFYHNIHEQQGVKLMVNTKAIGFEGDSSVTALLADEQGVERRIETDLVIIGIGIQPNVELAEAAGIDCDNGILVDNHCRTSQAHIYAAGDCTNHPNPLLNRRLRLESVPNAMEQARVAADNMLGGAKTYAAVPWFWSDQYDLKLQMVGFSADGDSAVMRGDMQSKQFAVFYLKDGKVVGVDAVNSPKEFMVCKRLYGKTVDPAALADPQLDLKSLLA